MVKAITDDQFDSEVLQSETPVLVDFWAEWCGPCQMIAPVLDEISDTFGDKLKICKVDIEENADTPVKYGVRGIPTLLLFKSGQVVETQVGAVSKKTLTEVITPHLN